MHPESHRAHEPQADQRRADHPPREEQMEAPGEHQAGAMLGPREIAGTSPRAPPETGYARAGPDQDPEATGTRGTPPPSGAPTRDQPTRAPPPPPQARRIRSQPTDNTRRRHPGPIPTANNPARLHTPTRQGATARATADVRPPQAAPSRHLDIQIFQLPGPDPAPRRAPRSGAQPMPDSPTRRTDQPAEVLEPAGGLGARVSGLSKRAVRQLQYIQNAAARVLTRTTKYNHISPVLAARWRSG